MPRDNKEAEENPSNSIFKTRFISKLAGKGVSYAASANGVGKKTVY